MNNLFVTTDNIFHQSPLEILSFNWIYDWNPHCTAEIPSEESISFDCGKELNRDGEFNAMIINLTLLSIAMDEMNDTNKPCLTQIRVIEHWWDGNRKLGSITD